MKHIIRIFVLTVLFIFSSCNFAYAQIQHVGVLANGQFEGSGSGNGAIYGIEAQHVEHLRVFGQPLKIVSKATFTLDKKVYRNQFGGALRATSLVRYAEPRHHLFFAQGGINVGGIAFPNTPGTSDGYAKYLARPVVGGGVDITRNDWSVVVDYQFLFKRKLYAQKPVLSDFRNRVVDGWSSGQRVAVSSTINLSEKWLFLLNGAAGWYSYQRHPAQYGAELGAVVHRFNAYEVSVGVGRKYGK